MGIVSKITLKDDYSKNAQKIVSSANEMDKAFNRSINSSNKLDSSLNKAFGKTREIKIKDIKDSGIRKSIQGLQSDLRKTTGKDYRVKITAKTSGIAKASRDTVSLKDKINNVKNSVVKVKTDTVSLFKAKSEARQLSKELTKTTGVKHKVKIGLEGGNVVTQTLDKIKNKLSNLGGGGSGAKGLVMSAGSLLAGAVGTIGAGAMAGKMWQSGSALEQQQISMKHFLGGDQKQSDAYLAQLRNNANVTPFETGEVVQAGTRAVQIAGGDTKKGMEFVKLAEDMAALNPGKTISDAMEALADADMGEMERLKEFGFKGSKEEFDKAKGNLFKMKDVKGNTLQGMYKGGAEKLSMSAKGLISTIKGKIGSGMADAGLKLIDSLKPVLEKLVPVADKIAEALPKAMDKVIGGFQKAHEVITPIIEKIGGVLSPIIDTISEGMTTIQPILSDLAQKTLPLIQSVLGVLGDVFQNLLLPAFTVVADIVKNVLQTAFQVLGDLIKNVVIPVIETLTDFINNVLRPIFEELSTIIRETVLPVIKKVADYLAEKLYSAFKKVTDIGTKLADKFKSIVDAASDAVSALKGIGDKVTGVFDNAKSAISRFIPGGDGNANGTSYYGGGVTKINERGEELIDLPRGSRIYPQGKTDELIRNSIKKQSQAESKIVYYQPKVVINGSNMDKKELLYELEKRFKRLAVNV